MKTKLDLPGIALALLIALNVPPSTAFAQGSLTPPGAPGPTMLTLSQMEPRTPISSAPFTITQPGSYYLTGNLTVGSGNVITIATNGVTLDLSGFTISSTAASAGGCGILLNSSLLNITIANGFVRGGVTNNGSGVYAGGGFLYGIYFLGNGPVNVLVSRISVSGCLDFGIFLNNGDSTVAESCTVRTIGGHGIVASTVKESSAVDCGTDAILGDQVSDCRGQCTGSGNGIYANATALNCFGDSTNYSGVVATTAINCSGISGSDDGIYASTALNCQGVSSSNIGVYSYNVENCNGYCSSNSFGIYANSALNSYGVSTGGDGIGASIVQNCYGSSGTSDGISGSAAMNCYGVSNSGNGIVVNNAENCYGYTGGTGYGFYAYDVATGCFGYSNAGVGLYAFLASVCHGSSTSGTPMNLTHNVNCF